VTRPNQKPQTKLDFDHVPLLARCPFHLKKMQLFVNQLSRAEDKDIGKSEILGDDLGPGPWFWSLLEII